MKIRAHRGFLADSMDTIAEIAPTKTAIIAFVHEQMPQLPPIIEAMLCVEPYIWDTRLNWNTYIVSLSGYGVLAFTDGPLQE